MIFTPLEIMPRFSLRARGSSEPEAGPAAAAESGFIIIPGGGNAPLGFQSRYSGTGISNGVSLSGKHNLRCFYFSVKWKEIMDTSKFLMFWVERERSLFMVALADICREIRKKGD